MPTLSRSLFLRLRDARRLAYRAATVIDSPASRLNHKHPWPPIHLRREIGPLKVFESSAADMYARLRYEAGLTGDSNLLDMGCGVGALPLQLDLYAPWSGSYHGIDVDNRMIAWCQGHLSGQRRTYDHFDYWNGSYNTGGQRFIPFPVEDNWADVIVMKSVFTHMLPEDVDWYLLEVARVLRPDGSAVLSALLFNGDELDGFPHDGGIYRYQRAASPESSIALRRSWMDERMAAAGLTYQYTPAPGPSQRPMLVRHLSAN